MIKLGDWVEEKPEIEENGLVVELRLLSKISLDELIEFERGDVEDFWVVDLLNNLGFEFEVIEDFVVKFEADFELARLNFALIIFESLLEVESLEVFVVVFVVVLLFVLVVLVNGSFWSFWLSWSSVDIKGMGLFGWDDWFDWLNRLEWLFSLNCIVLEEESLFEEWNSVEEEWDSWGEWNFWSNWWEPLLNRLCNLEWSVDGEEEDESGVAKSRGEVEIEGSDDFIV